MRISAFIQARLSSKRLPQKVLKTIGDKTILEHIILRLKRIHRIKDNIYLLVPYRDKNVFSHIARKYRIKIVLGDEYDVLSRFVKAANISYADYCIRLTADNPFIDIGAIREGIQYLEEHSGEDIALLSLKGLPLGMGVEFVSSDAIFLSHINGRKPHHREHVTTYIKENPSLFRIHFLYMDFDEVLEKIRLTIDEEPDLELAREIYDILKRWRGCGNFFGYRCVKKLYYRNPSLFMKNAHIKQRSFLHSEILVRLANTGQNFS